jgi:hypothetical protein
MLHPRYTLILEAPGGAKATVPFRILPTSDDDVALDYSAAANRCAARQ